MVKASDLIKINQTVLIKQFKKGYLPQTIEPLFHFKSDADERLTNGYQNQFATELPGHCKIGLFREWNCTY